MATIAMLEVYLNSLSSSGDAAPNDEVRGRQTPFHSPGLVAGGVPLLLALAVVVLLRPRNITCDLKLEFVRFDITADRDCAVLEVRNESSRTWVLLGANEWLSLENGDQVSFQALGRFATGPPREESGRASRSYMGTGNVHVVNTNTVEQVAVPLPRMGEKGWVELFCWTKPKVRRGPLKLVQRLWWRLRPPRALWVWLRCDVPIECGRELSDGGSTRPRVVSQRGDKSSAVPRGPNL